MHELYVKGLERYEEKAKQAEAFLNKYNLTNPDEIFAASVRFVLGNPHVGTVCCSMRNFDELEKFVSLSGTRLTAAERNTLKAVPGPRSDNTSIMPSCCLTMP